MMEDDQLSEDFFNQNLPMGFKLEDLDEFNLPDTLENTVHFNPLELNSQNFNHLELNSQNFNSLDISLQNTPNFNTEDFSPEESKNINAPNEREFPIFPMPHYGPPPRGDFEGNYGFEILLSSETADRKKFLYSRKLNRVYLSMLAEMSVQFKWTYPLLKDKKLFIRATLILADTNQQECRVTRCHNHKVPSDVSNRDVPKNILGHVLRSARDTEEVIYCGLEEEKNQWLSVAVAMPVEPSRGSESFTHVYKFCCKHSCTSGINRRRIEVLFTLEDNTGEIHGRKSLGVRVCSCPRRDMDKDEEEIMKDMQVDGAPPSKKKKMMKKSCHSADISPSPGSRDSTYSINIKGTENYKVLLEVAHGLVAKDYLKLQPGDPAANELLKQMEDYENSLKMINSK